MKKEDFKIEIVEETYGSGFDKIHTNCLQRIKIISGFPAIGKSFLSKQNLIKVLDSDSSTYSWIIENGEKIRNKNFPNNYLEHIKENIGKVDVILVSSHKDVRQILNQSLKRPDICLGDSKDNTPFWLLNKIDNIFDLNEFKVSINYPYSGTIVPKKYIGATNVHSIMIEINRDLYMKDGKSDSNLVTNLNKIILEIFN